ncbi:response regulator transcription factor [Nitrogeniibacter mangrovi]|uniref:Response regulator transcription factor n=1 Tax=Nitrogeniibacter mangrovi TaxID=2016596 RepID=A0A6C1B9W4_9RHOO|nr:response regulator transcription factor [Nitrogeniibacter mangrovi]QID19160.1 response regulator transcription factor [Nitrogeniibacter mangrovi]
MSHARILIIEDEPDIARLITQALDGYGFVTEHAATGRRGLEQARRQSPDLAIVDLGLPDMDGMEVIRQLQQATPCAVLILTGRNDVMDRVLGLELGADDYLAKPFEPRELVARVRSILRRYLRSGAPDTQATPGVARFGDWRFEAGRHLLIAPDGREVGVSATEASMLQALLRNPNRILSREQLIGERDIDPYDRSVDVRISRLRRKLEDDPQNPRLIKTVYGAGYLFATTVRWD